jgi:hypothetical protein
MNSEYMGEFLLFSSIAGGVVGVFKSLIHFVFSLLKLAPNFYDDINTFLVHGHSQAYSFLDVVFAELGDFVFGSIFGIFLGLWLCNSRPKYHWWIGMAYGVGIWFFTLAIGNILKIIKLEETTDWALFGHLLAMLVFGLLFVLAAKLWRPLKNRIPTL